MKPSKRGQRRAQFMAGIGDEVGAHFLDPAQRRQVVEGHQQNVGAGIAGRSAAPASRRPRTSDRAARARKIPRAAARAAWPARRMASTSSGMRKVIKAGSPRRNAGARLVAASLKAMTRASRSSTMAGPGKPPISASISSACGCRARRAACRLKRAAPADSTAAPEQGAPRARASGPAMLARARRQKFRCQRHGYAIAQPASVFSLRLRPFAAQRRPPVRSPDHRLRSALVARHAHRARSRARPE